MKINKNKNTFFNFNDGSDINNNNLEDIHLNYLSEFCATMPKDKKSTINNKKSINLPKKDKKTEKEDEKENEEENDKDELEDEVGSIDEFHNTNDNRSILSSYIFTSVHLTESKSISQSICTKSDYQEVISNYNDIASNRGGINLIPQGINNKEFEIRIDKGMNFMPFLNRPQNYQNNPTINNFLNTQLANSIKKMKEKINNKDLLIKKNNDNIINIKKKLKNIEEESKQYERWIENEEGENKRLTYLLNYLMENK